MITGHVVLLKLWRLVQYSVMRVKNVGHLKLKLFNTCFVNSTRNLTEIMRHIQYIISYNLIGFFFTFLLNIVSRFQTAQTSCAKRLLERPAYRLRV